MTFRIAALGSLLATACAPLVELPERADLARSADPRLGHAYLAPGPSVSYMPRTIGEPEDWRALNAAQTVGAGE
ncbi:hypothetical protein LCGC14_2312790 [marine sediment metagenome]|uniref:Uncharacterized protein n=1 Tax=marine sediment metagenome TaxID=412755 RepID=A0A0F9CKN5_9ZZZZ